jgi:hypothetical protein
MMELVKRGLDLLAGKTCESKLYASEYYCCAEKYWSHVERILQASTPVPRMNHHTVGLLIAKYAVSLGEWV